jgi:signal transduction histidine kinase
MARTGGLLFAAGGTIGLISLAFPGGAARSTTAIVAVSLAAYLLAGVEFGVGSRLPAVGFQILTAVGTGLVSVAVHFGGASSGFYRPLYAWVVLYAAYFFSLRATVLHLGIVAAAYAVVLALRGPGSLAPLAWFLAVTTFGVMGGLVFFLRARLEQSLAAEMMHVRRLLELDRLKDEFVATASHELRTPVTAVYGALVTLRNRRLDPEQRRALLEIAEEQSSRLIRLVEDVLSASQLRSNRLDLRVEPCDPVVLARGVVDAAALYLPATLSIVLEAAPAIPAVAADSERLRQIVTNLVDNAVKYSPDGGKVTVRVERRDAAVRIAVEDDGLGIPAEERERVFEKFHRLDPHLLRGVRGSGLGLYIARELALRMGGHLSVAPRQPTGSQFVVELPIAGEGETATAGGRLATG